MSKFCQSCGMPKDKDPNGGGTEQDGHKSAKYCSYCYQDGDFTVKNITAKQMQDLCVEQMCKQGWIKPLAWLMTRNVPRLERWQEK